MLSAAPFSQRPWRLTSILHAAVLAAGLLAKLSVADDATVAPTADPTTAFKPAKEVLTPEENPYGLHITYNVAWHNASAMAFGSQFSVKLSTPGKGAYWAFRFQFADTSTRVDNFWGNYNITRFENGLYLCAPVSSNPGEPAVKEGDDKEYTYSFNGHYTAGGADAMFPNGYYFTSSKDPKAPWVIPTRNEVTQNPLNRDAPPPQAVYGEFNRLQKTASNGGATTSLTDGKYGDRTATVAGDQKSSPKSVGSSMMSGLIVFCSVLAVGLTVVGVATYRRREYRRNSMLKQSPVGADRAHIKLTPRAAELEDAVETPSPTAINNHSAAARAAAGAVIMEDMNAQPSNVEEYYVMEDVAPDAHHHHIAEAHHHQQHPGLDGYGNDDGVYYADYDADQHQEYYPVDGEGMHQLEDDHHHYHQQQYDDGQQQDGMYAMDDEYLDEDGQQPQSQQPIYESDYVDGLPDYALQYDDQVDYVQNYDDHTGIAQAQHNEIDEVSAPSGNHGNGAIEHVDLRPPVAQEYYVSDAIAYDDEDLEQDPAMLDAHAADMYAHDGDYHGAYEAGEYEATEFDEPYDQPPHH